MTCKSIFLRLLPITAGLLLAACTADGAQGPRSASEAVDTDVATTPVRDVDPALWAVSDGDTTIYLFGTIHVLKPGLGWFDDAVRETFDSSSELVLEMLEPEPSEMMALVSRLAIDQEGKRLRDRLSAGDRRAFDKSLAMLDMAPDALDQMEPWMASVSLSMSALQRAGFDSSTGVETALTAAAKASGKTIIGLETPEEQLSLFDRLPMANQLDYLNLTIRKLHETRSGMDRMIAIWSAGKPDGLAKLMNEGIEDPLIYRQLLVERNLRWADWIGKRMEHPGTVFMAVGAAHLAGRDGLIATLAERRMDVRRIAY